MMNVKKEEIDSFFNNIKSMFASTDSKIDLKTKESENKDYSLKSKNKNHPKLKTNHSDKPGDQRTNVMYLNTDCNLRCEYCYEISSRTGLPDQQNLTTEDVDIFLNEICERENDCISTIVIMGGEPFLYFDMVEYIILKTISLNKRKKQGWAFSIISNGTLFTDNILTRYKKVRELASKNRVYISQEVSYDGSGQYRRKWPDGSNSITQVEKGIQKLIDYDIPFRISYTVHSGNYKNVIQDCIYMLEKYPLPYNNRITVGYAYADLDSALGPAGGQKLKKYLKPYFFYIFDLYGVPICGNTCGYCKNCDRGHFIGNSYLSPTTGISYDNKITEHEFQQF